MCFCPTARQRTTIIVEATCLEQLLSNQAPLALPMQLAFIYEILSSPLAWIVERTVSFPIHHAIGDDGELG